MTCPCGTRTDLCDALATQTYARSFVDLARAPCFQRRWPSLDEALEDGRIARPALHRLFVATAPRPAPGRRLVLALDASPIPRPYARTAADRTLVHVPAEGHVLPRNAAPVTPSWTFSTLVVVPDPVSSWTHILDKRRIPCAQTLVQVAAAQLADVLPLPRCVLTGRAARPVPQQGPRHVLSILQEDGLSEVSMVAARGPCCHDLL